MCILACTDPVMSSERTRGREKKQMEKKTATSAPKAEHEERQGEGKMRDGE